MPEDESWAKLSKRPCISGFYIVCIVHIFMQIKILCSANKLALSCIQKCHTEGACQGGLSNGVCACET